jgi:hypothetical protein
MKERTVLQRITDALEASGITVSAIETWPPDEDGRVSETMVRTQEAVKNDCGLVGPDAPLFNGTAAAPGPAA